MQELSSTLFIADLHASIRTRAAALVDDGIDPHVGVLLVGENPDSLTYVGIKERRSKEDGIILSLYHLEEGSPYEELVNSVSFLASDPEVHGIIIQMPLPAMYTGEQVDALIQLIPTQKDVDGLRGDWATLSYTNDDVATLASPQRGALPPMVLAIMSLLEHYKISLIGKKVVVVGKGRLVGQPVTVFFQKLGIDVQSVDEETENIFAITSAADILITGTGEKELITYQWVKEGAYVIDCSGDVHTDSVSQKAAGLSPTKGGIGPLTVAWLLHNVLNASVGSTNA